MAKQQRHGNIDPAKKLYRNLGKGSSHDLNETVAEWIDNSIEARTDAQKAGTEELEIHISINSKKISVQDNGKGMNGKEAISSLKLAETSKKGEELGQYGVGLKTAALHIADTLNIGTGKAGSNENAYVHFNINEWESNPKLGFGKPYPYEVSDNKPISHHGTLVEVTDLRFKITDNKIAKLKSSLGSRYRSFIRNGMKMYVNSEQVKGGNVDWEEGYPQPISITTKYGEIRGIIGLMKHSSQIGNWGLDLFRNGRLIMEDQKFGISGHPGHAYIKGEVHLDFVPVNQDKNKFLTDTPEYETALESCAKSEIFIKTAIASNKKRGVKEERKFIKSAETILDALAQALKNRYNDFPVPRLDRVEMPGSTSVPPISVADGEPSSKGNETNGKSNHNHKPSVVHKIIRYTTKSGKTYRIQHESYMDEDAPESKLWRLEEDTIYISVNTGFPAYQATSDRLYYVGEIIVESLADIHSADSNLNLKERSAYKDSLLKETFEIIAKKRGAE